MTAAVLLTLLLLSGCASDTIYVRLDPQETAAPSDTAQQTVQTVTEEPTELPEGTLVWVPTKGGKKYHATATCSSMQEPKQITKAEAEEQGFTPCKRCYE